VENEFLLFEKKNRSNFICDSDIRAFVSLIGSVLLFPLETPVLLKGEIEEQRLIASHILVRYTVCLQSPFRVLENYGA
jgi:hypothetical protein